MRSEPNGKPEGKRPEVPDGEDLQQDPQRNKALLTPQEWEVRFAAELAAAQADREARIERWRRRWRSAWEVCAWVLAVVLCLAAFAGGFCLLVHSGILRG